MKQEFNKNKNCLKEQNFFTIECCVNPQVPNRRIKYVWSQQWEADYLSSIQLQPRSRSPWRDKSLCHDRSSPRATEVDGKWGVRQRSSIKPYLCILAILGNACAVNIYDRLKCGGTSVLWSYFGCKKSDVNKKSVLCKLCRRPVPTANPNTINLVYHLQRNYEKQNRESQKMWAISNVLFFVLGIQCLLFLMCDSSALRRFQIPVEKRQCLLFQFNLQDY